LKGRRRRKRCGSGEKRGDECWKGRKGESLIYEGEKKRKAVPCGLERALGKKMGRRVRQKKKRENETLSVAPRRKKGER